MHPATGQVDKHQAIVMMDLIKLAHHQFQTLMGLLQQMNPMLHQVTKRLSALLCDSFETEVIYFFIAAQITQIALPIWTALAE